ncbi:protein PHLOEM PROTEIN 2-LIKE A9-like [Actinidia eriantha]|uniref:protein PHLOEM PROTEIN 2-LIKE A9-like n=1 Tax=Actinidia eriantha TaxID=165200 RepID=UPI0025888B8D|nr:protein PHLOEM PROTEIN 2-LIKE A9-like [Actinidia eriantha]
MGDRNKTITPDKLNIVWNGDDRYWRTEKGGVARLLQVCWLEVTGTADVKTNKRYKVSFTVSLTPDAFGWSNYPVCIMARAQNKKRYIVRKVKLSDCNTNEQPFVIPTDDLIVDTDDTNKISFGLYEVWSGMWKGGLKIHDARVEEMA